MALESYRASAPGNIMLLGEHAVLHGRRAIVCAVSRRITTTLTPREDDRVHIVSPLGEHLGRVDALGQSPTFRFVVAALELTLDGPDRGFDLVIESDFASDVGLGSSAAVTVATVAACDAWRGRDLQIERVMDLSIAAVRGVQGLGSGADVAASVYGGAVSYRMEPRMVRPLTKLPPIALIYSGHKEPTVKVVKLVEALRTRHPDLFKGLFDIADKSAEAAVQAIERENWPLLGSLLNVNQGLMEAYGVSSQRLADIVFALRSQPGIHGAKISGSGLGDCVVGIGQSDLSDAGYDSIPVEVSREGVRLE